MSRAVHPQLQPYLATFDGTEGYIAGLPGYPRNFSRDVLLAGLISMDEDMLLSQIRISTSHQGEKYDPHTGEEPGKIHHEWPGVTVNEPYLTTYNACDTTALYLIALEALLQLDPDTHSKLVEAYQPNITAAVGYIESHLKESIFWEYPPEGAAHYSLRVTYWKDSIIPATDSERFDYPVSYALAQFQAARGMLSAARLLQRPDIEQAADAMFRAGIAEFMRKKHFCVMKSLDMRLEQASSDELHILAYLPTQYLDAVPLRALRKRARLLYTSAGIACTPKSTADTLTDRYHGYVVWPFEQALIHYGCKKFGLDTIAAIAARTEAHIADGHELIEVDPTIKPAGNDRQLWSVAAQRYFAQPPTTAQQRWL